MTRDETIRIIRNALRDRSGKQWSVRGGAGTTWGWITISAPPRRRDQFDHMTDADRHELGTLLSLDRSVHHQGETVPGGDDYYREYIDRASGRTPTVVGKPHWD